MPRKGKKNSGLIRMVGVATLSFTPSFAVINTQNAYPGPTAGSFGANSTRLNQISDAYLFFRFKRLGIEIIQGSSFSAANGCLGWYPQTGLNSNPTHAQNNEAAWSLHVPISTASGYACLMHKVHWIPKKLVLPVMVKWFRTRIGGSDGNFEIQGDLVHTWDSTVDGTCTFRLHYEIEFKDPAPPAVTVPRLLLPGYAQEGVLRGDGEELKMLQSAEARANLVADIEEFLNERKRVREEKSDISDETTVLVGSSRSRK